MDIGPNGAVAEPEVRPDPCPVCGEESWVVGERFGPAAAGRPEVRVGPDSS